MQTSVLQRSIAGVEADALIVHHFSGAHRAGGAAGDVDRALAGLISELAERGDLATDLGRVTALFTRAGVAAPRVLVVGLGDPQRVDAEAVRRATGEAVRKARDLGARRVAIGALASGIGGLTPSEAARATVEGARLGLYRYRAAAAEAIGATGYHGIDELLLVEPDADRVEAVGDGVRWGEATAAGVELARDLVNLPPNVATPTHLAKVAEELARDHGFAVTIGDRAWAEARGMGAFLAVAQGAGHEPRFIVLEHDPSRGKEAPLVLVGKGVTFDSGGVSIKGRAGMEAMKSDMAGAAAVLGAMRTLGRLRSPRRVVALVPATENMLDAHAYRPADVLRASNGLTIEVISTDAEGRLLLADALAYAQQLKPKAVVDLATLTGACVVALGRGTAAGRFANDDALAARVDYPWVHLDIAGMAMRDDARGYHTKGATGFGVRLLVHWVTHA